MASREVDVPRSFLRQWSSRHPMTVVFPASWPNTCAMRKIQRRFPIGAVLLAAVAIPVLLGSESIRNSISAFMHRDRVANLHRQGVLRNLERLGSNDPSTRYRGLEYFRFYSPKHRRDDVVALLTRSLKDEDWRLRYLAAEALLKARATSSLPMLEQACEDPDERVRKMAARAVAAIADPP